MHELIWCLGIGLCAAIVDTLPMVLKKIEKDFVVSAFCFWLGAGVIIPQVTLWGIHWLDGVVVAYMLLIPLLPLVKRLDRKALPVMCVMTALLGGCVGYAGGLVVG